MVASPLLIAENAGPCGGPAIRQGAEEGRLTTPTELLGTRVLRRNPKIEEAPLQGELMLFDPGTSKFFVLNRTMAFIWRNCDGQHTPGQLLEGLKSEFSGVEAASAEAELKQALEELRSLELVVD